jgi:hypothetical protein
MTFDEYHFSWNFNNSSLTLIPFSFGNDSNVYLLPELKINSKVIFIDNSLCTCSKRVIRVS